MSEVVVVIGAGSIGQAIARRVSAGKHVVLADLHDKNSDAAAEVMLDAGFDVTTTTVDVSSRDSVHALVETASGFGDVTGLIHAAGVSPSQAPRRPSSLSTCTALRSCSKRSGTSSHDGGAGVVIASQSGHRLGAITEKQNTALATTPADELLKLPFLQPEKVTDPPEGGAPVRRPGAPPDCPVIALVVCGQAVLFERNLRGTDEPTYPAPHTVLAVEASRPCGSNEHRKRSSGPNPVTVLEEAFRVQ